MAVIEGGGSLAVVGAGAQAASGLHVIRKPIDAGALGHYRVSHRFVLAPAQAAGSRLFAVQNTGANLHIPLRAEIRWLMTGAHTAAIEDSLDITKLTGFTVMDTVNVVTPTASRKRTSMAAAPGGCAIRGVTAAGAAAGMTGGTSTLDGGPFAQLVQWLLLAQPTAGPVEPAKLVTFEDMTHDGHPFVFAQNEGFVVTNRVLLGAAAGSSVYIDYSWAEVTAI